MATFLTSLGFDAHAVQRRQYDCRSTVDWVGQRCVRAKRRRSAPATKLRGNRGGDIAIGELMDGRVTCLRHKGKTQRRLPGPETLHLPRVPERLVNPATARFDSLSGSH
jgi:hypothetical protein